MPTQITSKPLPWINEYVKYPFVYIQYILSWSIVAGAAPRNQQVASRDFQTACPVPFCCTYFPSHVLAGRWLPCFESMHNDFRLSPKECSVSVHWQVKKKKNLALTSQKCRKKVSPSRKLSTRTVPLYNRVEKYAVLCKTSPQPCRALGGIHLVVIQVLEISRIPLVKLLDGKKKNSTVFLGSGCGPTWARSCDSAPLGQNIF